jgi:hypothetical protein
MTFGEKNARITPYKGCEDCDISVLFNIRLDATILDWEVEI